MNYILLKVLGLLSILTWSLNYNFMNTPNADVTCDLIQAYLGQNASNFTSPASFINTVLYNDPSAPFSLKY